MGSRSSGISGLAVGLATMGGIFLLSSIRNVSIADAIKDIAGNRNIGTTKTTPTGPSIDAVASVVDKAIELAASGMATGIGEKLVSAARSKLGKPYVWGAAGPDSFDCSGLVTWALQTSGVNVKRMYTQDFYVWSGAKTVSRNETVAGDLVCWPGHIGIAVSNTRMIHAPTAGDVVKESDIWWVPTPIIRRVIV